MGNIEQALDLGQGVYTQAEIDAIPSSLSKVASNVLLSGNLALASSAVTKSNANITYTGNGSTQSITTGIGSVDFTVASNGSGYYHDRAAGDCIVKNDAGTIVESGSAVVNTSKVHIKGRTVGGNNNIYDGLRGTEVIYTDLTNAEETPPNTVSYTLDGISISGSHNQTNGLYTYILHQTLYTHIKWGLTNQGKRYITAYNPVTREVMTMYQGSGLAGHQIPNPLGIKLDYIEVKHLNASAPYRWVSHIKGYDNQALVLNTTSAIVANDVNGGIITTTEDYIELTDGGAVAELNNSFISYGFANSETKIITQYQGTGASGNFVETKDVNGVAKKPRRVIIKRTDGVTDWYWFDSARTDDKILYLSGSYSEDTADFQDIKINGIIYKHNHNNINASGGQYIAIVEFDTTNSTDDTYFDLPTDDTNLNVTAGKLPYTDGRDTTNGAYNVFTQSYTGSVDFSTCPDGIHYVALDSNNAPKFYEKVAIGSYEKESADDNRLVFNTESGKWYTTTDGELVTNGTFDTDTSGWTAENGATLTQENGSLKVSYNGTNYPYAYQLITTVVGTKYKFKANLSQGSATGAFKIFSSDDSISYENNQNLSSGEYEYEFVAETTSTKIWVEVSVPASGNCYFDNISVYKKDSTLDTPLTTPISFIDDKPYQVQSGTPVYRFQTRKDRIRRSS